MPYFFATAVFEVRASSREDADRVAIGVLEELHHRYVRYLEHSISGSFEPTRPGEDLFFTVIGDFDVDAPTEEKASDLIEETLDTLSTDSVQYLTHGLIEGERRGRAEKEEEKPARRRVERKKEPEVKPSPEEEEEEKVAEVAAEATEVAEKVAEVAAEEETREAPAPGPETVPLEETLAETPEPVPQPLFSPIRAAITVTLQTSELSRAADGATVLDEETLAARAIEEARQRYPEIPADLSPQSSFSRGSGEGEVITLTWEYEVPLSTSSGDQPVSSDP